MYIFFNSTRTYFFNDDCVSFLMTPYYVSYTLVKQTKSKSIFWRYLKNCSRDFFILDIWFRWLFRLLCEKIIEFKLWNFSESLKMYFFQTILVIMKKFLNFWHQIGIDFNKECLTVNLIAFWHTGMLNLTQNNCFSIFF